MRRLLLAAFALLFISVSALQARADGDRVSFLHDITISSDEEAHDTVCILCSIRADGPVHGDAVAILGSIHANAPINGDVVAILGNVTLSEDGSIGKDCVVMLGSVSHHNGNQIGKDVVQFPLGLIFVPLLVFFFLIYVIRSLVRRSYVPYPMPPPPPPMR
jgi:predicted acyltransferase (DUF342 family)